MKKVYYLLIAFLFTSAVLCCTNNGDGSQSAMLPLVKSKTYQDAFKIYNHPKSDKITISFRSRTSGQGIITVYYADGRIHGQKPVAVNKGANTWEYSFPNKPGGIYTLRFTFNTIERTQRIFKANT